MTFRIFTLLVLASLFLPLSTQAQSQERDTATTKTEGEAEADGEKPEPLLKAPYDDQLLRLSEVLGAIHYLRNLCGGEDGTKWRDHMQAILTTEDPHPSRKARLVARFNRGFRAFDHIYKTCTPSALLAADRYQKEGVRVASQINSRYGR